MAVIYGLRKCDDQKYFYVGSTKFSAQHRFTAHMTDVRLGNHANKHFVNKVNQVGADNITVDVLEEVTDSERYQAEHDWIKRLLDDGHKLVNRMYVDVDPSKFASFRLVVTEYTKLTPERFRLGYELAHKPPPKAKNPQSQDILNKLHALLLVLVDSMITRFPEQVAHDFGFISVQENERNLDAKPT